jgi:hypothetical protein
MTMDRTHETETTTPTARPAATRNRRRIAALGAAFALATVGAGAMVAGAGGGSTGEPTAAPVPVPTTTVLDELVDVAAESAATTDGTLEPAAPAPQPKPQPPAEPQAQDEPAAEQPPAEPEAAPGVLAVSTGLIELPEQTWAGTFQVRNDGGSPIDWQWAAGAAGISVSHTGGTLQPGEFVEVAFTIDHTVLPAGDFLFANCVYTADQAKDVRIEGTKTIKKNPQIELPAPVLKS